MPELMTKTPLTGKEGEALLWGLSIIMDRPDRASDETTDPLAVLLNEGFTRNQIMAAGPRLYEFAYGNCIIEPLSVIERAVLRVCVENTTWLEPYAIKQPGMLGLAKRTLRDLAAKLENIGIEVNHIPNEE